MTDEASPKPRKKRAQSKFLALRELTSDAENGTTGYDVVDRAESLKALRANITEPGTYFLVCVRQSFTATEQKQIVFKTVK